MGVLDHAMVVYQIRNKLDGKRYIGQTVKPLRIRWNAHNQKGTRACPYVHSALMKYGRENFEISVLARCRTLEEMNHREAYYIRLFGSTAPSGYNLASGGRNRRAHQTTRRAISERLRWRGKNPTEAMLAGWTRNKGKKRDEKTRAKLRVRVLQNGKKRWKAVINVVCGTVFESISEAARAMNIPYGTISSYLSEKVRRPAGAMLFYLDDPRIQNETFAQRYTAETVARRKGALSLSARGQRGASVRRKEIVCVDSGVVYVSAADAAERLGLDASSIAKVCRGKRLKRTGGLRFVYLSAHYTAGGMVA